MSSVFITSKTYGRHQMFYDDEDHEVLMNYHWMLLKGKNGYYVYAQRKKRSSYGERFVETYLFHREILKATSQHVDHIDGNSLNNCKANLRQCTARQNTRNRTMSCRNTSGYKGVSWNKKRKMFRSRVNIDGKDVFVKFFNTAIEAAVAYNQAVIKHFGEYAKLNTI